MVSLATAKILVVDDDASIRFFLSEVLKKEGCHYETVDNGFEAVRRVNDKPFDLIILDHSMPGMTGLETFEKIRAQHQSLAAIMITAHGNSQLAVEALNHGITDYFTKPLDLGEMRVVMRRALERVHLRREVERLREALGESRPEPRLVGSSPAIQTLIEQIEKIAPNDVSTLIQGESGTGKERVALALHHLSKRREGPFITVNCGAVPPDLLESEFFGHEKGAFTGADRRKPGQFELADKGTLFLDEIGDMPLHLQTKILRALEENRFTRVGGTDPVHVDFRLVTATHRDLQQAIRDGEFREDLYYRLNVVSLNIPPLRERLQDLPLLADHFINGYNQRLRTHCEGVSAEGLALLAGYSWPGNIRELENVIQRALVLTSVPVLGKQELLDVYPALEEGSGIHLSGTTLEEKLRSLTETTERRLILEALNATNWKRQETADRLGISRKTLHNKMKKYALDG